ncbi:hypothetical protein CLF_102568 [Clonorchis sinensis]|uniref:Endonuclease/exonuclease/phosphatase domain-containing protein n=1 Tax=Clonorchis sinensis TaxID=79923 RepID=G7Y850_CLOSI|nr:hypothetical protein CLF_102568 [Clonorchis sinensis]
MGQSWVLVDQVTINAPLGHSDHCVLTFDFICYWARNPEPQTWIRNFCRADFSRMRIFLNQVKLGPASVEDLYRTIVLKVHEADAMFVPKKPARSRMSRKLPKRIRRLLEKRSQLFFKKLTTGDTEDELAFRKMRNRCKSEIRQWNIRKQATILDLARKNRNVLFKYMRHRRRNKPSAYSVRDRNGEPTSHPIVVSEFYRDHYAGLYSVPASSSHPTLSRRTYDRPLTDLVPPQSQQHKRTTAFSADSALASSVYRRPPNWAPQEPLKNPRSDKRVHQGSSRVSYGLYYDR